MKTFPTQGGRCPAGADEGVLDRNTACAVHVPTLIRLASGHPPSPFQGEGFKSDGIAG